MKSTYYKGYELRPKKYNIPGGIRYQIQTFKDGVSSFDTSYCDTLKEAREEAKEAIKGFFEPMPPAFRVRPILFSTEMVHALKEGRKFQTRRLVKGLALEWLRDCEFTPEFVANTANRMCPYGKKGDVLYVRETFQYYQDKDLKPGVLYRADQWAQEILDGYHDNIWKPNIFMPKKLARLWLRILDVRIEPLQDITEQDAIDEGIQPLLMSGLQLAQYGQLYRDYSKKPELFNDGIYPIRSYQTLFEAINGPGSWNADPWVWVVKFEILLDLTKPLPAGMTFDPEKLILQFTTGCKTVSECLR